MNLMKKAILSCMMLFVTAAVVDAQPAPTILCWRISYKAATPPCYSEDKAPTFTCTNGKPATCKFLAVGYFDNAAGRRKKWLVVEQQVPEWVTVDGQQVIQLFWRPRSETSKSVGVVLTTDLEAVNLTDNAGYDCLVRCRGLYQVESVENGEIVYGPVKVGKTGATWKLTCGAGGGATNMTEAGQGL